MNIIGRHPRPAIIGVVLLAVSMVAGACSASTSPAASSAGGATATSATSGSIRIAVDGPITGPYANVGKQIMTGAQLGVDDINAAGGVRGMKLEMVQIDDQGDPGAGMLAAQKVADDASIVGTLGWLNSAVLLPVSDLFAPLNLSIVDVAGTRPSLTTRGYRNFFRLVAGDDKQSPAQYLYLKKVVSPLKSLALIDDGTESLKLINDTVEKMAVADGVKTMRYSIRSQDKDFRAVIGTIPKDVSAMVGGLPAGTLALWVQQAKELGFNVPIMSNDSTLDTVEYIRAANGAAEGNFATTGAPDSSVIPTAADFVTKYKAAYNEVPSGYSSVAYVAVQVMADAITRASKVDRAAITEALQATNMSTILGPLTFDKNGDPTPSHMYVYKVVDAGFVMVDTIDVVVTP